MKIRGSSPSTFIIFLTLTSAGAVKPKIPEFLDGEQRTQNVTTAEDANDADWVENWEAPLEILRVASYYKAGQDEEGVPVYVAPYGIWNWVALGELPENLKEAYFKFVEQCIQRIERDGLRNNEQGVVILVDWDGFEARNLASSEALRIALRSMMVLPRVEHVLKYAIMINTNFAAQSFMNIVRPFVGTVMEKVEVYGTRPEQWKARLLRKIPASQLPPEYGGTKDFKPLAYGRSYFNRLSKIQTAGV